MSLRYPVRVYVTINIQCVTSRCGRAHMDKIRVGIGEKSAGFLRTTRFEQFPEILIRVERRFPEPDSTQKQTHTQTPRHPDTQTPRCKLTHTQAQAGGQIQTYTHAPTQYSQIPKTRYIHIYRYSQGRRGKGNEEKGSKGGAVEVWKDEGEKTEFLESGAPCITYRGPAGQSRISMGQGDCNPPACGRWIVECCTRLRTRQK